MLNMQFLILCITLAKLPFLSLYKLPRPFRCHRYSDTSFQSFQASLQFTIVGKTEVFNITFLIRTKIIVDVTILSFKKKKGKKKLLVLAVSFSWKLLFNMVLRIIVRHILDDDDDEEDNCEQFKLLYNFTYDLEIRWNTYQSYKTCRISKGKKMLLYIIHTRTHIHVYMNLFLILGEKKMHIKAAL